MIGSGNNNYELFLKRIVVLAACELLVFMSIYLRGTFKYISHKKDYVSVKGTVVETTAERRRRHRSRGGYRYTYEHYTIIKVTEFDGTVYQVKATRRLQDKIGETVIIAINPLDDKKNIIEGVWTRGFCPYGIMGKDIYWFEVPILIILFWKRRGRKDSFRKF